MEKGPLETFRLFVLHKRPLTSDERGELRREFDKVAPVRNFFSKDGSSSSMVSFADTATAVIARQRMNGVSFHDVYLHVRFTKPTTRVLVRGFKESVRHSLFAITRV